MTFSPLTQRRLAQFKSNRRGYWALWIFLALFIVTLFAELVANDKPIVAQFCAFAVLRDGSRAKTANSSNSRYCDELFAEWIRERYS